MVNLQVGKGGLPPLTFPARPISGPFKERKFASQEGFIFHFPFSISHWVPSYEDRVIPATSSLNGGGSK
jgi:hypothetical protein